ncbi:MAG TPA: 1,4-alpha-glucan branching protein GlgB [bacterium]|nr:1,4-alpha-glucan branching protein GlgB [bacterium]
MARSNSLASHTRAVPARDTPGAPSQSSDWRTIPPADLQALLQLRHGNPHAWLGPHAHGGGCVLRVLHPEAEALSALPEGLPRRQLDKIHPAGVFGAWWPGQAALPRYRLQARYANGDEYEWEDPYRFAPTLGDLDLYLFGEGRHQHLHRELGARFRSLEGVEGFGFTVWAPNAVGVSVVGDFNYWDGRRHAMRSLGSSGVWELFVPGLQPGLKYKFEIRARSGSLLLKADPYAIAAELPPGSASVLHKPQAVFQDQEWLERRALGTFQRPISIYEVHAGSWRRMPGEHNRPLRYRELAHALADYVVDMGFTHVEFLPLMEHPFGGSWGYQVSAYLAPTARYGTPEDFDYLVNHLHERGIGVLLDWVPAHFPKDAFALARFDGTALYEHEDPRQGEHPDWGTLIFNYVRNEVRNFLLASAMCWLQEHHVDGLRADAVASMLYLDYSRAPGQWVPNAYGGRENLPAIAFLKELNEVLHAQNPGVLMVAEESTAWGGVSRPTYLGGLGFGFKWNMGWMHDTLEYFSRDPIYRQYHHNNLTFGLLYAWSENFILPLSHDEVVHGKGSLINKMPGDRWQKFANLRALYGYMWAHPGRKMLFMGGEIAQWSEWHHDQSLDWHLLNDPEHRGVQQLVRDLNRLYRAEPALWEAEDNPATFEWLDANNAADNVIAFMRIGPTAGRRLVCVCNLSPVLRHAYRVGLPAPGGYAEILNTDSALYGGSNVGNGGAVQAEARPWNHRPYSATLVLPPLATLWLEAPPKR